MDFDRVGCDQKFLMEHDDMDIAWLIRYRFTE